MDEERMGPDERTVRSVADTVWCCTVYLASVIAMRCTISGRLRVGVVDA